MGGSAATQEGVRRDEDAATWAGMGPEGDLEGPRKLERSDPEASVMASGGDGSEEG